MNKILFEAIIEITNQRDSDSLPCTLLLALADVLPLQEAMMYKVVGVPPAAVTLKQILKLSRQTDWTRQKCTTIIDDVIDIKSDVSIEKCIDQLDVVVEEEAGLTRITIPIIIEQKITTVLQTLVQAETESSITDAIEVIRFIVKIYENHLTVVNESERDKLTGLYNRRTFDSKLSQMLLQQKNKNNKRYVDKNEIEKRNIILNASAWLVMLDIDFFKRVNDEYGHVAGDEVLLHMSQKMQECFRHTDLLFRFGGEEFVIVLDPIPSEMAQATLERFRNTVSEHAFPYVGKVTISIGYAMITEHDFPATVLDYADKALYYAKEHGRNCVHNYELLIKYGGLDVIEEAGSIDLF